MAKQYEIVSTDTAGGEVNEFAPEDDVIERVHEAAKTLLQDWDEFTIKVTVVEE